MPQLRRSTVILRAYNIDHKKGQVWATTNERSGCDFIIFNHLTKLLFCLHYCLSSDCSLTMSVKTSDPKAYFTIKNMASQIWCLYLFLFCTVGGGLRLWSNDESHSCYCYHYHSIMVYGEDDDEFWRCHRGDCQMPSLFELYWYVMCRRLINSTATTMNLLLSLFDEFDAHNRKKSMCYYYHCLYISKTVVYYVNYSTNHSWRTTMSYVVWVERIRSPTLHNTNNNNNSNAGWGLMFADG